MGRPVIVQWIINIQNNSTTNKGLSAGVILVYKIFHANSVFILLTISFILIGFEIMHSICKPYSLRAKSLECGHEANLDPPIHISDFVI